MPPMPVNLPDPDPTGALACAERAHAAHDLLTGCDAARTAWALPAEGIDPDACAARRRAGFLLAHFLYRLGQFAELMSHGPQAVDLLVEGGENEAACQVMRWMALGGAEIGSFELAIASARRGLELSQRTGQHAMHVLLTNALAACFERMGDPWQAERLLREALVEAEEEGGDVPRFVTFNNLTATALTAYYLLRDGDAVEEAERVLLRARIEATQGLRLAERIDDPFYRVYIESNLGDVLAFLGEHDAAERHLGRALALAQSTRFDTLVLRVQCSLGELALERGRAGEARDILVPLVRSLTDTAPAATVRRSHHALYRTWRQLGDAEAALRSLEHCQRLERRRLLVQLRAQAHNLVTRAEIEQAYRDARYHRERAATLVEVADQDRLTGLTSRWGLEQRLLAHGGEAGLPLAVALLDLDNFKPVNDLLGHAAGDTVLMAVAEVLKQALRQQDIVARLGGDEFAIVLPGADRAQAVAVLERIRQSVNRMRAPAETAQPLRLSIGLAMMRTAWNPENPLGEWLAPADGALYECKRWGGDCLTIAEDS